MAQAAASDLLLTLDRGNRGLVAGLHEGGAAPDRVERIEPDGLGQFLATQRPARALGCAVRGVGLEAERAALAALGLSLELAGEDLACPLQLAYGEPEALGVDRWVAAVAAREAHGDALVVDCGSALTVDAVHRDGRFVAGAIAPGHRALGLGLSAAAPALPPAGDVEFPARSSEASVANGLHLGFLALVQGLVERLAGVTGLTQAPVLVTGGDDELLLGQWDRTPGPRGSLRFLRAPHLVLEGLACLARTSTSKS